MTPVAYVVFMPLTAGMTRDNRGATGTLGRPPRLLAMDVLLYFLGVPLMLAALIGPWDALFKGLLFVAGVAVLGIGVYIGHGAKAGKTKGGVN